MMRDFELAILGAGYPHPGGYDELTSVVIPAWIAGTQKPGMTSMEYLPVIWMSAIPADMTV